MMQEKSKFEQSSLEVKRAEFKKTCEQFLKLCKDIEQPSLEIHPLYDLRIRQFKESINRLYDKISGDFVCSESENPDCIKDWSRYDRIGGVHGKNIPIPSNKNKEKGESKSK